ncbi:MAG: c-type cytochrome [Myxococcales bacterium]|nr:c-type cytochrome [Myxococcales bacterium]MCB9717174.1 c-type cytochrome [Myxococcales bacterium]
MRWLGAGLAIATIALGACQDPNAGGAPTKWTKAEPGSHEEVETLPSVPPRPSSLSVAALLEKAKEQFSPLPEAVESRNNPITEEKVTLGRMLYFDPRLSKGGDIACATCHDLEAFGVDVREEGGHRLATSLGFQGQKGDRNAPTVYNAGLYLAQFWDGRSPDLEDQAKGPVLNPVEMAMPDEATVVATLKAVPGYVEAFATAFPGQPDPITYDNMAKAIGAFERQLMTPGPFDDFLAGKLTALDEQQLAGLDLFMNAGCIQCHTGPAVGGTMFQKLGTVKPWEGVTDEGRFKITKAEADKLVFKVPSLRNITKTGPYLHDGSITSLEDMVQKMATHQLAKGELTPDELSSMIAFLGSLEGRLPEEYIAKPTLPGSGAVVQEPVEDEGEPAEGEPSEDEAVEDEAQPEPEPAGEPG